MPKPLPPTRKVYGELQQAFDHFNETLFGEELRPCVITFQRDPRSRGYLAPARFVNRRGEFVDEIALHPGYLGIQPIRVSLSTLVHECVHSFQVQFGQPGRRGYHNREWAEMMEERGLMPSDTGEPGGKRVGESVSHYIIDGGKFDVACDQLISQRYAMTWVDRFPPEWPEILKQTPPPDDDSEGAHDEGEDTSTAVDHVATDPADDDAIPEQSAYVTAKPAKTKATRTKYRCPMCLAQVWGKPNLSLICGNETCGKAWFEPVD